MAKKTIKMNEAQLREMVAESVKNTLKEYEGDMEDYNEEEILNYCLQNLSKENILLNARKNGERPFGFIIDYIKDSFQMSKIAAYPIAEKVLQAFSLTNTELDESAKIKHEKLKINESQLRKIIAESIKKVLKEETEPITIGSPEDGKGCHVTIAGDSLGPYAEFNVYGVGTDAQAAVDAAVDYLEKNGETGYFWDNEEEAQEYPDDFVTAGNCGHLLRVDLFHVEQM